MLDLKELVFTQEFRENYPQFDVEYEKLDKLGGSKCKSCNLSKQKRILNTIRGSLMSSKQEVIKLQEISDKVRSVKKSEVSVNSKPEVKKSGYFCKIVQGQGSRAIEDAINSFISQPLIEVKSISLGEERALILYSIKEV